MHCALLADDLTGACDGAAPFKLRGARSIVCLSGADHRGLWSAGPLQHLADDKRRSSAPPGSDHDVVAVSTESRDLDICAMQQRIRDAASRLAALDPGIVFKKIDSTLRGNIGAEIATALQAFDCEFAIITPAFPRMRRMVRNGHLYVEGDAGWQPINIAERLRTQGLDDCVHITSDAVAAAIERGRRFLSLEAVCGEDLEAIVAETFRFGRRVLYAGSAGLAGAVAKVSWASSEQACSHEPIPLPCIFCVGSDHPVTVEQLAALADERSVQCFTAGSTQARPLADCLQGGHHAIVSIARGAEIRVLLESTGKFAAALLLSGGDTASLVCSAIGAEAIELEGEIVAGLPWGRLQGGVLNGFAVATKSGGFGAPDALIEVADFFTCHRN